MHYPVDIVYTSIFFNRQAFFDAFPWERHQHENVDPLNE